MEKRKFAFVVEPIDNDSESEWAIFVGKERDKILARVKEIKERTESNFFEVEVEDDGKFAEVCVPVSFDKNGKPYKAWFVSDRIMNEDDFPCVVVKV